MARVLLAFVPVIHKGYLDLFKKYPERMFVFGENIINSYKSLLRDVRAISPAEVRKIVSDSGLVKEVKIIGFSELKKLAKSGEKISMIDDDVSRDIARKYLKGKKINFEKVFLRWDKLMTEKENIVPAGRKITKLARDRKFMAFALGQAEESSDWWRQIGTVAVKSGRVLFKSHNRHLPTDFHLSAFGDPRVNFDKGEKPDVYTSIHGEADIVARAARKGVSLKGASIYVSTFPCSNCARLLSVAGIKKVFYSKGYSRLDAEKVFNAYGVEIILVK